jgi:hypothetical protein
MKLDPSTWNIVVYGDDNIVTTMKTGLRVSDFAPYFKEYFDMDYTHFSKKDVDPHDTLETIRYLGRSFVTHGSNTFKSAPLELSVIVESTYWTNGSKLDYEILFSTVDSFVVEVFHFGRDFYRTFCGEFIKWIEENVEKPDLVFGLKQRLMMPYYTIYNRNYGGFKTAAQYQLQSNLSKDMPLGIPKFQFPETNQVTTTRNTEFSNRATAEPSGTQEVPLGTYMDVSPVTDESVNPEMIQNPYKSFNMEAFTVDGSLEREYPIGTVTWSSSLGRDTTLATWNFPDILFEQEYIQNRIKDYHYFRGGIRITFRVVSNQFLYGCCMVSFVPYPSENNSNLGTDVISRSGLPHMLISASASDAASFNIPFICKNRVLDILNYVIGQMAQVSLTIVTPLINATDASVCAATIFVTAQFTDTELFLPITLTSNRSGSKGKEANNKSKLGIISSTLATMTDVASAVSVVPFMSPYASMFKEVAKPAQSMFERIGLSKPTTTAMTQVGKINPYLDINQGAGLGMEPKLGFDPNNGISTVPNVGGQSIDEMELLYVAGMPQMSTIQAVEYSNVGDTFQILGNSSLAPNDYQDNVNALFGFHAGSTKVALYIFASKYHSVRLVFWINQTTAPAVTWSNCYHRVVDVQGDTNVFFTLPYMNTGFATNSADTNVPNLFMTVLSYNQPDNALPTPIYVIPYKAAASDYKWGGLLDTVILQSNPRADFSRDFEGFHPSVTGYSETGLLYGETYRSFREVIHRSNPDCSPLASNTILGTLATYQTGGYQSVSLPGQRIFTGLEKIGQFYLFNRGSVRLKIAQYGTNIYPRCLIAGGNATPCPFAGAAISSQTNPVVELDIPWYTNLAFGGNNVYNSIPYTISSQTTSIPDPFFLLKSGGDDFSFQFVVPIKGTIVPATYEGLGTFGTYGLFNALNTPV